MTAYEETVSLRKSGNTAAAYELAMRVKTEEPQCVWVYNQIAWCLYGFMQAEADSGEGNGFLARLQEYADLNREHPIDPMITKRLVWPVRKFVAGHVQNGLADEETLDRTFDILRQIPFDPHDADYHILLGCFVKAKGWHGLKDYIDWWGLDNLGDNECKPFRTADGKTIMSLAEQTYIAYANSLLAGAAMPGQDKMQLLAFAERLGEVAKAHPEFQYPSYFQAKLLLVAGHRGEAVEALLPFVEKKATEYWVWDLLGDAETDDDLRLSCYCKALTCHAKEQFLRKLHLKTCDLLLKKGMHGEARAELDAAIAVSRKNGWSIPYDYQGYTSESWYLNSAKEGDNTAFYKENCARAEQLAYADCPEMAIVVIRIDKERCTARFVTADRTEGLFPCRHLKVKVGGSYMCRMTQERKNRYKVHTCKPIDGYGHGLLKRFHGCLSVKNGGYGFADGVFVPAHVAGRLGNGADVAGTAIPSFDAKRGTWGWTMLEVAK